LRILKRKLNDVLKRSQNIVEKNIEKKTQGGKYNWVVPLRKFSRIIRKSIYL